MISIRYAVQRLERLKLLLGERLVELMTFKERILFCLSVGEAHQSLFVDLTRASFLQKLGRIVV